METEWLDPAGGGESISDTVLRRKHEAAYVFARRYSKDRRVVDVACGVAYGARILGNGPRRYLGIDRSVEAVRTAAERNAAEQVRFTVADASGALPVASDSAELVLALQIVEHVPTSQIGSFLEELRRVCREDGRIIFTTPNRKHRLLPLQSPWNPYHVQEFDRRELERMLEEVYAEVSVRGLRADREIENIELKRVRQNPVFVYGKWLLRMVPSPIEGWIREKISSMNSESRKDSGHGLSPEEVTVERFDVVKDPRGEGIDLVAVCRP